MTIWDKIECGFSSADESVNFGTRAFAHGDSCIYEASTIATIRASDKSASQEIPHPCCQMCAQGVALGVDRTLAFFNRDCDKLFWKYDFDSVIKALCVPEEGPSVFVCLNDLTIVRIDCETGKQLIFSPKCFPENIQNSEFLRFVCLKENIYSVFSCGSIVEMKNISKEIDFGDKDFIKLDGNLLDHLFVETAQIEDIEGKMVAVSGLYSPCSLYLCDNDHLLSWSFSERIQKRSRLSFVNKSQMKKIEVTSDERYIVCLRDDGELSLLSNKTLCFLFALTSDYVRDFVLVDTTIEGPVDGETVSTCVLYLTKTPELCLFDLEANECKFQLAVSANISMISQQINTEGQMHLESTGDETVDTIMIKFITETAPENRLERLLQRGKFEQAKQFATLFNLNPESVLKAEVQWLMGTLPLWTRFDEETLNANYAKMRSILDSIKDVEFVAEVCIKTFAPDVLKTLQLLDYAVRRLSVKSKEAESTRLQPIVEKVRSLQLTLGTFLAVNKDSSTSEEWLVFSSRNPALTCMQFVSQGQMEEAIIVCRRHQHQIQREIQLMYDMAVSLLHTVPIATPSSVVIEWLCCYVPILLKSHQNALQYLVNFIMDRAKMLENRDARNWPNNADTFVSACLGVINNVIVSKSYGSAEVLAVQQSRSLPHSAVNQLVAFQQHLKALSVLRYEYKISIAYDLYYSGLQDEESAKHLLLMLFDAVPEFNIEKLITEFVPKFNMALYKDISSIVSSYLFDLIVRYLQNQLYSDDLYWEARCISFINCMNVLEDKLSTIIRLVEFANVPWSDGISQLVESTLLIKHPLVATLEAEKSRIPQKLILKKYDFSQDVELRDIPSLLTHIYGKNKSQDFPSMLEDGKQLVAHDSSYVLQPYITLVIHAFENDRGLDDALDLCQRDLTKSDIEEVKESVLLYTNFKLTMTRNTCKDGTKDTYYEKVKPLISKLSQFCPDIDQSHGTAAHLMAVCKLNEEFKLDYRMNDLYRRKQLKILEKTTEILVSRDLDADQLVISAAQTASLMFEPEDLGLIELADRCLRDGKMVVASKALRRVCDNNRIFKSHSSRITELLMASEVIFKPDLPYSPEKSDLIEVLTLTAQLNEVHTDDLTSINNFLRLCKIYTVHHVKPSWSSSYTDPIESPAFTLPKSIFSLVSKQGPMENPGNLEEELKMMCQSLPKDMISLSRIQELGCFLAQNTTIEPSMLKEIKQSTTVICRNILMNIFSDPRIPDLRLALSLLQNFLPDQILPWLQYVARHKRDMKFSKNMSLAVNEYCSLHKTDIGNEDLLRETSRYFSQLNKVSTWSLRAYRHGIPYKEALADTVEEQMRFLKRLIAVNDVELKVLESYCKDMGLDVQECYVLYIKHALLTWEPKYKTFKKPNGKQDIVFEDNVDLLKLKCQSIVSKIQKPKELIKMLLEKDFWNQINTYYYEVFMIILEIASTISSSGKYASYIHALAFLRGYTRVGSVQDEESTEWFTTNPGVSELPEIAHYRLPFRSCPFNIAMMEPEISLDTYRQWLGAPSLILTAGINRNVLCTVAIKNSKTKEPAQPIGSNVWNLQHCKRDLLDKIVQCVEEISDEESAVAVLYYVVNNIMPPGIDQVEAAQQCYLKADLWRRNVRTEVAASKFAKAEKKYFTVSTQHVLHASGLGKPEYLSLAMEPALLVTELYNNPAIIDNNINTPSINQAVERIISLHDLDPVKIILELLTQWLHPEAALQATLSDSILNCSEESDEDNITRACYMLLGNKHSSEIEKYLVAQAFPKNPDDTSKSHGVRLRALRILLAITTQEQLESITARSILTIREYLQVLDFLNELEKFGLVYTVSSFKLQRKEVLLDTILHNKHLPAVRLALKLCRAYSIKDTKIISKVFSLMMQLDMMSELEGVLIENAISHVEVDVMKTCWNAVMVRAILKADRDAGTHDAAEVQKVTNLLYSCPDLNFLDLEPVVSFFTKVKDDSVLAFLTNYGQSGNY